MIFAAVGMLALTLAQAAEAGSNSGFDFGELLNRWGFPLALVIALMVGRFVPGFLHDRLWKEKQASDAEIRRLSDLAIDKVLPAVTAATEVNRQVIEEVLPALQEVRTALRDAQELIRAQQAVIEGYRREGR